MLLPKRKAIKNWEVTRNYITHYLNKYSFYTLVQLTNKETCLLYIRWVALQQASNHFPFLHGIHLIDIIPKFCANKYFEFHIDWKLQYLIFVLLNLFKIFKKLSF